MQETLIYDVSSFTFHRDRRRCARQPVDTIFDTIDTKREYSHICTQEYKRRDTFHPDAAGCALPVPARMAAAPWRRQCPLAVTGVHCEHCPWVIQCLVVHSSSEASQATHHRRPLPGAYLSPQPTIAGYTLPSN